jgi:hypothetical protein
MWECPECHSSWFVDVGVCPVDGTAKEGRAITERVQEGKSGRRDHRWRLRTWALVILLVGSSVAAASLYVRQNQLYDDARAAAQSLTSERDALRKDLDATEKELESRTAESDDQGLDLAQAPLFGAGVSLQQAIGLELITCEGMVDETCASYGVATPIDVRCFGDCEIGFDGHTIPAVLADDVWRGSVQVEQADSSWECDGAPVATTLYSVVLTPIRIDVDLASAKSIAVAFDVEVRVEVDSDSCGPGLIILQGTPRLP